MKEPDDLLVERLRSQVRAERPYIVPGARSVPYKLNQNESPFDLPPVLKRELLESWFQIPFNRYPSEQPDRLVHALATSLGVDPSGILVGNGSNELTHTIGLCLIRPDRPVVVPRPMFALYESVIRLFGGRVVGVAPRENLQFDTEALLDAIRTEDPDVSIVTTPNNPTGLAMPFRDVKRIVETARGFVVVDEAYHEFNPEASALTLLPEHPNVIVVRTLSKAFGLAGIRLGYLVAHPEVTGHLLKARLPFMVDRMAESVGMALVQHPEIIQERIGLIQDATARLTGALQDMPAVDVLPSQANFVLFRTGHDPSDMLERLADRGVLVRNMGGYPELKGWLRVNAGTPHENQAFLDALTSALSEMP
ncbi:MAG: histidinol-phosphate transaminase [Rhodothermales bacterium]